MAKGAKVAEKKTNDWPIAVLGLYVALIVAYLPILCGALGPIGEFEPGVFFAIVVAPVSLVCLVCGFLGLFVMPRPSMVVMILVIVVLVQVLAQLIWVAIEVLRAGG